MGCSVLRLGKKLLIPLLLTGLPAWATTGPKFVTTSEQFLQQTNQVLQEGYQKGLTGRCITVGYLDDGMSDSVMRALEQKGREQCYELVYSPLAQIQSN